MYTKGEKMLFMPRKKAIELREKVRKNHIERSEKLHNGTYKYEDEFPEKKEKWHL